MFNAIEFCQDYGIQYWTAGKNVQDGWTNVRCPFCDDHSNHCGIEPIEEYVNCWRCGWHSIDSLINELTGLNANTIIGQYQTYRKGRKTEKQIGTSKFTLPGKELQKLHKLYLTKRNFDPDYLEGKYKLKGVLHTPPEWKFRIIIPIMLQEKIVSFQSRACYDTDMRYITCGKEHEIIHHKHLVYNTDNCFGDSVIVVEGVPDVWRLGDNTICPFGTEIISEQIKFMASRWNKFYFIFDPEKSAQEKALKTVQQLNALGAYAAIINYDSDKDPGDLSDSDAQQLKKEIL